LESKIEILQIFNSTHKVKIKASELYKHVIDIIFNDINVQKKKHNGKKFTNGIMFTKAEKGPFIKPVFGKRKFLYETFGSDFFFYQK